MSRKLSVAKSRKSADLESHHDVHVASPSRPTSERRTSLAPELLSHIFLFCVGDAMKQHELLLDSVRPHLVYHTSPVDVRSAREGEQWSKRSSPWEWLKILHVCQYWREVALACPRLWTWMVAETGVKTVSRPRELRFAAHVREALSRSARLPLDISCWHSIRSSETSDGQFLDVYEAIFAQFSRVRSARFNITSIIAPFLVSPSDPFDASSLQSLDINFPAHHILAPLTRLTDAALPHLCCLTVQRCSLETIRALVRPTVTELTVKSLRFAVSAAQFLDVLDAVPSLRRLELRDVFSEPTIHGPDYMLRLSPIPRMLALPHMQELRLMDTAVAGQMSQRAGLASVHFLDSLDLPITCVIFFDTPSRIWEPSDSHCPLVLSHLADRVSLKASTAPRSVRFDGETGHRYWKFWPEEQTLSALATGNWTTEARLSVGLWGSSYFQDASQALFWTEEDKIDISHVSTVYTSMVISLSDWLEFAEMQDVRELCVSGKACLRALRGLVSSIWDRRYDPRQDSAHDLLAGERGRDDSDEENDGDSDEDDEIDELAFNSLGLRDEYDYIFPVLAVLELRHLDFDDAAGEYGTEDVLAVMITALQHRRRALSIPLRLLKLTEVFHFTPKHLLALQNADVADVVEWDGKEMDRLSYRKYDYEYIRGRNTKFY